MNRAFFIAVNIRYVRHKDIDFGKWDKCIGESLAPKAYAFSQCLNHLCEWDALMLGDHEAVWPLPVKKKWGIRYGYQPPFLQQLGLFSSNSTHYENWEFWLNALKRKLIFSDMQLNHRMRYQEKDICIPHKIRTNYVLNLNQSYESIRKSYAPKHRSRLNKIERDKELTLKVNYISAEIAIDFFSRHQGALDKRLSKSAYDKIRNYMNAAPDCFDIYAAYHHDLLCGIAIFMRDSKRRYLIMSSPNEIGRKLNSQLFLIDRLIAQEAGNSDQILDFEGSDFPKVGHFYKKFGCINEPYLQIRHNIIPLLSTLKKDF